MTPVITRVTAGLLLLSLVAVMYCPKTIQAEPTPVWPNYGHFWALVTHVGGSVQPEFTGCYAKVLIVYMPGIGALKQNAIVLTKENNICTLLQTAYETQDQGEFRGNLSSDLPLPAVQGLGADVKPVYDLISVCINC